MGKGLDAATNCGPQAACIKAAGFTFVARYYPKGLSKSLTLSEAKQLSGAELFIVSVFETNPTSSAYFAGGNAKGVQDGQSALATAQACGQPHGTAIYFTVDFDAGSGDVAAIEAYFDGVRSVLNGVHLVGVYGSGLICSHIKGSGRAHFSWLAMSTGWAGSAGYTDFDIKQTVGESVCGISIDVDESTGAAGGWQTT
jgi:hypothetical protein